MKKQLVVLAIICLGACAKKPVQVVTSGPRPSVSRMTMAAAATLAPPDCSSILTSYDVTPTDKIGFSWCVTDATGWTEASPWYKVMDAQTQMPFVGAPTKTDLGTQRYYELPAAYSFPEGSHAVTIQLINHCEPGVVDPICTKTCPEGTVCLDSVGGAAGPFTIVSKTPVVDVCPTGAVVLAVGDWTRSGAVNSSGRVLFSLTKSVSPVVWLGVYLDGVLAPENTFSGTTDWRKSAGAYFKYPATKGTHTLSVTARDAKGCEATVARPMSFTVK